MSRSITQGLCDIMPAQELHLTIDHTPVTCVAPHHATLRDLLCELNLLNGQHDVCEAGDCCHCTVLLAGAAVCACQVLAWEAEGQTVQTVGGLAAHPLVARLRSLNGPCGDCLGAFALAGIAYLQEFPTATPDALQRMLQPIPCTCGLGHYLQRLVHELAESAEPT